MRRNAIRLVEATNLLIMEGRHVAKPGEKSENPGIELEPAADGDADRQGSASRSSSSRTRCNDAHAGPESDRREERDGLLDSGEAIDTACENCHLKYWYPLNKQAEEGQGRRRGQAARRVSARR